MAPHDPARLYRALLARDPRFDGVFFVGVTSTGIYCRPVCPAPTPRADRCRYYASAAAAERRGFRPCLRCRPELAPGRVVDAERAPTSVASIDAVERLARVAAARIAGGALDLGNLDDLAAELGVSGRHLRRAVERTLGATPVALAQTRRLLTAKQLLTDTNLPVTQVALASGFASLRRFNALFRDRYRLAPTALRRAGTPAADAPMTQAAVHGRPTVSEASITLSLAYRPPFEWTTLHGYLAGRATPGVEAAGPERGGWYARTVSLGGASGWIVVAPRPAGRSRATGRRSLHDDALRVELSTSLLPVLVPLLARLRRLFDLDADPGVIDAHLSADDRLAPLVRRRPGLRVPGALDGAELAVRAVLGQQVSVRGATTLAGRLARELGGPVPYGASDRPELARLTHLPCAMDRLAEATADRIASIGLPRSRATALRELARAITGGTLPELAGATVPADPAALVRRLVELPGIGPWTAAYIAMRGLQWPDAFPAGDLGLRKAMGGLSPARLRTESERWSPWRAYAAHHLWASAADAPPSSTAPARRAARRTSGAV